MKLARVFVSACLVAVIVLLSFAASAESIDFSKYNDAQLMAIYDYAYKEMIRRGMVKGKKIPAGHYVAGVDLPAGSYMLTAASYNENWYPNVKVYKDKKTAENMFGMEDVNIVLPVYGECKVTLEEGNVLSLENVSYYIEKFDLSGI